MASSLPGIPVNILSAPLLLISILVSPPSWADEAPKDAPKDVPGDATAAAREAYREGTELVKAARWGDALVAFERAASLRPHALTSYNLAITERSLGRLTRARSHLVDALSRHEASGKTALPASYVEEASGLLREIDALLVSLVLRVDPPDASLTIDGRPVVKDPTGRSDMVVAGLASPDAPSPRLEGKVRALVDPGARVFVLSKSGFSPSTYREVFKPGARGEVPLSLVALDATIAVRAERPDAVVRLQGLDVGAAPVVLRRPPGSYSLDVRSPGFVTYATTVDVGPGASTELYAKMPKEPFALTKKWWFWTGLAAVVAGAAITVYAVTRPPAPYDGGTTGWVAEVR